MVVIWSVDWAGDLCHLPLCDGTVDPVWEAGCGWADDFGGGLCGNKSVLVWEHWRNLCGMQSFGVSLAGFGVSLWLMMPDIVSSLCYQKSLSAPVVQSLIIYHILSCVFSLILSIQIYSLGRSLYTNYTWLSLHMLFFWYTCCWHKYFIIPSMAPANLHLTRGLIRQSD